MSSIKKFFLIQDEASNTASVGKRILDRFKIFLMIKEDTDALKAYNDPNMLRNNDFSRSNSFVRTRYGYQLTKNEIAGFSTFTKMLLILLMTYFIVNLCWAIIFVPLRLLRADLSLLYIVISAITVILGSKIVYSLGLRFIFLCKNLRRLK